MNSSKFMLFLLIIWLACVVSGCMGGNTSSGSSSTSAVGNGLTFSVTPMLQLDVNNSALMTALLINNSDKSVNTISFKSNDNNLVVLATECNSLQPGSSCKVNLRLRAETDAAGYLLEAFAKDESGKEYTTQQLFDYSASLTQESTLTSQLSSARSKIIAKPGEIFALAIPFTKKIVGEDVSASLSGLRDIINQEIICSDTDETQCTLIAVAKSSDSGSVSVQLAANNEVFYTATIGILASSRGNLVSSNYNVIVSPADGVSSTSFTLLNNGSESISQISMFASSHPPIESQISTSGCTGTLDAGASCTMQVKVNGSGFSNGNLSMSISYKTALNSGTTSQTISDKVSLWLYYLNAAPTPGLSLSYESTNFMNNLVGYTSTGVFTVTNTGSTALSNINITKLILVGPFTVDSNSDCYKLSTALLPGKTCQFNVNFKQTMYGNGYLSGAQAVANYKESNNQVLSIASNVLSPYYNSSPNFVYFGRWTSSLGGFDFCTFDNNGSVSNCVRRESTNTLFASGEKPETIQPMIMPDGTFVTYMVDNNNGQIYRCKTNTVDGTFTNGCTVLDDLSIYGLHIYKHGMWDTNSMKYYLYIGGRNYIFSDGAIGVCPIAESGLLISGGSCSTDTTPTGNPSSLMFDESKIYYINDNSGKVCTLNPTTGKMSSCSNIGGDISTYFVSGTYFDSIAVVVGKDNNGLKARYAYLSDMGGSGGDTTQGRIIRCTLVKNSVTNNLDFNNCTALITGMTGVRGLEIVSIESKNYLYYTNNKLQTNGLFSREILQGGALGSQVTQSAAVFPSTSDYVNDQMYVLRIPGAYFTYDKNSYTVTKGNSFTMKINFAGTGTIGSSRVFFGKSLIPPAITFNGQPVSNFFADFAVESGFDTKTVTVSVPSSVSAGSYTLSGITSNGVMVPSIKINVQ